MTKKGTEILSHLEILQNEILYQSIIPQGIPALGIDRFVN
jgi:hypothetical protein